MLISRNNQLYTDIDNVENHAMQYQIFLQMMRFRFFYDKDPKETQEEYIKTVAINESNVFFHSNDRDFYEMECQNEIGMGIEYFIKDYAYFNNINYQLYVNIDFSLPKEMLIAQISQLKDDIDKDEEMQTFFKNRADGGIDTQINFIPHIPTKFSKKIKRKYGDFLFILDCKALGYKNQDIIYSIYDFRNDNTSISHDTIRKYLKIAQEIYKQIELAQ